MYFCVLTTNYGGGECNELYTRNFLLTGLPCFLLGGYIAQKSGKVRGLHQWSLISLTVFFVITSLVEADVLRRGGCGDSLNMYFSSIPLAVCLLILFGCKMQAKETVLSTIGRDDSLNIYIFHIAMLHIVNYIIVKTGDYAFINWILLNFKPFFVVILSICFSIVLRNLSNVFHNRLFQKSK